MKTKPNLTTSLTFPIFPSFLLAVAVTAGACTAEFKSQCPDGTEQNGGGDVGDADVCRPIAGMGRAPTAGGGGQPGAGAGGGTAAGGAGPGRGGAGGNAGGSGGAGGAVTLEQISLDAGAQHTCVSTPRAVRCWGANRNGELGNDTDTGTNAPNPVPGLIGGVVVGATRQVSLGMYHSCSVRDGGRVLCWGANNAGQLGIEANVGSAYPTPVPALLESGALGVVTQLALGNRHACALRDDGRVLCWGGNYFGQLATVTNTGTEAPMVAPVLVDSSSLGVAKQVAVGDNHSCALRQDGRVFCWGKNWDKQLGSTATSDTFVPREINSPALGVVRQLALGVDHSCALRDDGRVLCWGDNSTSQLGAGQSGLDSATPVLIDDSALGVVRQLALGSGHSCALRDDGRVLCWGNNYSGQLGVGMNTGTAEPLPAPQLIANGTLGSVQRIAAGNNYTCALREDGQVLCWGDNEFGQLGTNTSVGTNDPNPVPAPVQGLAPLIP